MKRRLASLEAKHVTPPVRTERRTSVPIRALVVIRRGIDRGSINPTPEVLAALERAEAQAALQGITA